MISTSPLRYPGGKARFTNFIWESILASKRKTEIFIEPFCGGAGASISLLESGKVKKIALNDLDPLVSSFWKIVFGKSRKSRHDVNWLINSIETTKISLEEWSRQKSLTPTNIKEAAWKCLYLNRTSFNGIIHKAGPIGGWEQKNRSIDVRFNKEKIIIRINELYELRDQVERVESVNWKLFCSYYRQRKAAYLYLDPPYYNRAEQLYGYLFDEVKHTAMRDYLISLSTPWMLSYDDAPEIRSLYKCKGISGRVIDQTYSSHPMGGASFIGRELFFSNAHLPAFKVEKETKSHIGLSIVGCVKKIDSESNGPIRMPFLKLKAV
jgi:DNA adenine methylase